MWCHVFAETPPIVAHTGVPAVAVTSSWLAIDDEYYIVNPGELVSICEDAVVLVGLTQNSIV
jgi:hypothetical protein